MTRMPLFPMTAAAIVLALPAAAQDRLLTVSNSSPDTLVELYASPANSDSWGPDLMQGQTLATGEAGDLLVADGSGECAYNLRMVFQSGEAMEAATDLCQTTGFTIE
jgi:hypothetical protein